MSAVSHSEEATACQVTMNCTAAGGGVCICIGTIGIGRYTSKDVRVTVCCNGHHLNLPRQACKW